MKTVTNYENNSVVNNVVLNEEEQHIVDKIYEEVRKHNESFKGVYLLSQAIHRGFEPTYMEEGWRLMFQEPCLVPCYDEDGEVVEYDEEGWEWEWWIPSDVAVLLAYAHLVGDSQLFNSYPTTGWYQPQEVIQKMAEIGFVFEACPMIVEGKYDKYDTDLPFYLGTRYHDVA